MLPAKLIDILKKQHYGIVGKHSGVQICRWTKKSLVNEGECYKSQFYGIKSWRCCQMSPWLACQNKCLHCWRAIELDFSKYFNKKKIQSPKKLIEECVKAQRKLLSGFKGNPKINMQKFKQAQEPNQFAISLVGEPTLYPKVGELIAELRKQGKTSFLVTNGLLPKKLKELKQKKALPTQLYISLNYPNEKLFREITKNKAKNSWKKFNESLELLEKLKTRRVIRMTLIKDLNMEDEMIKNYVGLIKKASPDFIEVKGFMSVGFARQRLGYERMPSHKEIKDYAKKIVSKLGKLYKILDEHEFSRVVLIGKDKKRMKIKDRDI